MFLAYLFVYSYALIATLDIENRAYHPPELILLGFLTMVQISMCCIMMYEFLNFRL